PGRGATGRVAGGVETGQLQHPRSLLIRLHLGEGGELRVEVADEGLTLGAFAVVAEDGDGAWGRSPVGSFEAAEDEERVFGRLATAEAENGEQERATGQVHRHDGAPLRSRSRATRPP